MLSVHSCKFTHVLSLLVILLVPFAVNAQVSGGTISGRVMDNNGAVVPGAQVSIKNTATGVTTPLVANEEGVYRAPNLLPGEYEITASATNFTSFLQKGVTLTVGADLTIDLKLNAGAVGASVTVSDEAAVVDTTTPTISAVVNERTIVELPLNGRDWTSLATLQPGISSIRTQYASGGTASRGNRGYGDELTITGHRPQENNYRIDGVSINDYTNGAPGSAGGVNLGADAVKEFSVLASNYTAEYGRTSGGVINAITRSGSNSIHGSAYEFFRNDALDARNYFDGALARKPPLRRNQFGGSIGGPIIKNKTFFFADFERIRRVQGVASVVNVPSPAARAGNLCSAPRPVDTCVPTTVPVHANIAPFLKLYPLPNGGLLGNGDTGVFSTSLSQRFNESFFTTRIDHRISSKDSLFGTYMFDNGSLSIPDALNNVVFPNRTRRQMIAIEETHTFNQNFINSFRVGYNRTKGAVNVAGPAINPVAGDNALGSAPGRAAAIITVSGINDSVGVGGNSFFRHVQNSYQIYDDAFDTRGNHSLRFGFAFEKIEYNELGLRRPNGRVTFTSLSNFLQDIPATFFSLDPSRTREVGVRSKIFAGYVNDSWRYSSRLTLNLGVRYEMSTIPTEAHDQFLAVLTPSGPLVPVKKLFNKNPTTRNFEPRVGFAYDVFGNGKTAFRGGFGIYDALPLPWIFAPKEAQGTPFNTGTTVRGAALPPGSFPSAIFPTINFNTAPLDVPFTELNPSRNYIMNWNLTLQHQLISDWTLTAAYVGSRGVHMAFGTDEINIVLPVELTPQGYRWPTTAECTATPSLCNRLNPNASQVRGTFWDGNSHYNGLQLQIVKPLSHNFQAQGSYTYSKCIDEGSEASRGDQFLNGIISPLFIEKTHRRGRCSFDLRHVFVGNMLWNIPGPKEGLASKLLGNWQLGSIFSASSGVPFSVIYAPFGQDPLGLKGTDVNGWPDYVPGCKIENPADPLHYINTACFTLPNPTTRIGTATRNLATGPKLFNLDMAFYKNIPITSVSEGFRLQLRAEFFNILNHPNFAPPLNNNNVFNANGTPFGGAGKITSTQTGPRQVQLGIRLNW